MNACFGVTASALLNLQQERLAFVGLEVELGAISVIHVVPVGV